MKFYSSSFISIVLAFLGFMGASGQAVVLDAETEKPVFDNILKPVGSRLGPNAAGDPVSVRVFTGFGCKECTNFGLYTLPKLIEYYEEDSSVNVELVIVAGSEDQKTAARGLYCSKEYDRYWEMFNELHKLEDLSSRQIDLTGQGLEFPVVPFRECLRGDSFDEQIASDSAYATGMGIAKLPTIVVNGTYLLGDQPIENIQRVIRLTLNSDTEIE
jgi:protein-disulfide isomerase